MNITSIPSETQAEENVKMLAPIIVQAEGADESTYVAKTSRAATKTATSLLETPQAISVVTKTELEARNVQSVGEAVRYNSGVLGDYWGGADLRYDKTLIRGFDAAQYLNGLKLSEGHFAGLGRPEPYGLQRVEVLKGPSSVLYGQNAPGGLVNLVSKKPTAETIREINVSLGSSDRRQGSFDFGGAIDAEGEFQYRLVGLARDSATQTDYGKNNRQYIAPSFSWEPSSDTKFTILGSYLREDLGNQVNVLPPIGTLTHAPFGRIPTSFYTGEPSFDKFIRTSKSIGYEFQHRFDDVWTFRQNFRHDRQDADYRYVSYSGAPLVGTTMRRKRSFVDQNVSSFAVDNQAEAEFSIGRVDHDVMIGLDYRYIDSSFRFGTAAASSLDVANPVYGTLVQVPPTTRSEQTDQHQAGLYIQDQMRLDKWAFTLSGRYDMVDSSTSNRLKNTVVDQDDEKFTWRAGLVYLADNGLAPYASYSTSFEPTPGSDFGGTAFEPTTGEQYEIGVKYQPIGFDSFVTLSAYDLTQKNVTTSDPDNPGFDVQTGETRVRGIELEGVAVLNDSLSLKASYTYMDGKVTESNDYEGNVPAQIPHHVASLWVDYAFADGPLEGLGIGAGVRYVDERFGDMANKMELPSITLVDATLRYDLEKLAPELEGVNFRVNASNLFDKTYVGQCASTRYCQYGARRTVTASIGYKW
ncbi:TonB-dependent siderophore receptor [Breoghania sp.]|uniref:TonB-dependent siderophore receptor n=2 Tax=Breoghania sp. TaxID=2065378 RepID=UPI0029CA5AD1|nr:TonB-dependent siderophore receptor [Breoghania sp.]